jgi:hypothetical protein
LHTDRLPAESDDKPPAAITWFSWQPVVNSSVKPPPAVDPVQAAMAAQRQQFQIRALMESLAVVASEMAPHIVGSHSCDIRPDSTVTCDLPSEFEWNDKLINWLALQTQLQGLVKGNMPLSVQGKSGRLTLHMPTQTSEGPAVSGAADAAEDERTTH